MRRTAIFLLLSGLAIAPADAQQTLPSATSSSPSGRQVRHVMAPPVAARAKGAAAHSTAQTMAAHTEPPLAQVPSFAVTGLDGKSIDIGSLHAKGHWLLLYRDEHCLPCDKVMAAIGKSESPLFKQGASYVIVVKPGGSADGADMLTQMKSAYPTLANAAWVVDAAGAGSAALKPHGEPVIYAVSGSDIEWTRHGTMNNPASLEALGSTWLASTSKPHPAAASSTVPKPSAAVNTKAKASPSH